MPTGLHTFGPCKTPTKERRRQHRQFARYVGDYSRTGPHSPSSDNLLQKNRIEVRLSHDQPALPHDRRVPVPVPLAEGEAARKFFCPSVPRNSLISLDSDERIQGNPRKSNSPKLGFPRRIGAPQENPNGLSSGRP